jgi:exodeoxyribonuclease V
MHFMNDTQKKSFEELLRSNFKFDPTPSQERLFKSIDAFINDNEERVSFILKGFAGTGKTTFLGSFIKALPKYGWKFQLLAPTGRAAKVMTAYAGRQAQTIHRKIYKQKEDSYTGNLVFERQLNKHEGTIFIVDEASMISDAREFGNHGLLHDLMQYVFEGTENKVLFLGDDAQLPPVSMPLSPALDLAHIESFYHTKVYSVTLTDVMRQEQNSGILRNATHLREQLTVENPEIRLTTAGMKDFYKMTSEKIEDGIRYAYDKYGQENTIMITRSNKNAVLYNRMIRSQINYSESELDMADLLMVVKNNYTILGEESEAGFIANGEFVQVKRMGKEEEMHGFRFQQVTLQLLDYPDEPEFETLIFLDTLYAHTPNLSQEQSKSLYEKVLEDYFWVKSKTERRKLIKQDKYLNALQVKFAYALTCHKAQGGQWKAVFIDQLYLPNQVIDKESIKWLYTAITRGVSEVFLINFQAQFFGENIQTVKKND